MGVSIKLILQRSVIFLEKGRNSGRNAIPVGPCKVLDVNRFCLSAPAAYFCKNNVHMEQTKKHKGLYWLLFFASTAALVIAVITHWEWLTLILPFVTTSFVKAMDIM